MAEIGLEALKSEITKVARPQEYTIAQRMEANMQRLENKIESVFEALTELIRSRNRNTATLPMTDSDKKTEETGSRPTSTNLDGRSASGDRNRQEPRPETLTEAQTPTEASEEAEFRLQQLIASSKETERRIQQLYEKNQKSMVEYQRQCEEYWKQDELEEQERNMDRSSKELIPVVPSPRVVMNGALGDDDGPRVRNLSGTVDRELLMHPGSLPTKPCLFLAKLETELVGEDNDEESEFVQVEENANPCQEPIQDPNDLQNQGESSKVIRPPLQDVVVEIGTKELGKLVQLLIELIEIRLANGRTNSMNDIGVNSMGILGNCGVHQVFVETPRRDAGLLTGLEFKNLARSVESVWVEVVDNDCFTLASIKLVIASFSEGLRQDFMILPYDKGKGILYAYIPGVLCDYNIGRAIIQLLNCWDESTLVIVGDEDWIFDPGIAILVGGKLSRSKYLSTPYESYSWKVSVISSIERVQRRIFIFDPGGIHPLLGVEKFKGVAEVLCLVDRLNYLQV